MTSNFLQIPCLVWTAFHIKKDDKSHKLFSELGHLITAFNSGPYPAAVTWLITRWLRGLFSLLATNFLDTYVKLVH